MSRYKKNAPQPRAQRDKPTMVSSQPIRAMIVDCERSLAKLRSLRQRSAEAMVPPPIAVIPKDLSGGKIFSLKSRSQSGSLICACGCALTFPKTGYKVSPTARFLPAQNHRKTVLAYLYRLWHAQLRARKSFFTTTSMSPNCAMAKP